jgi:hypothetical protein
VASYSKQMIDVAKEWLAANPDPKDPFLRVPLNSEADRIMTKALEARANDDDFTRWERQRRHLPDDDKLEIDRRVEEIHTLNNEINAEEQGLEKLKEKLSKTINATPTPGHAKVRASDSYWRAGLGRWCLAWARHGYNVFELGADFTAAMLLTDARELDIESVRLPFRGILMLIPDGFARGAEGTSYTKVHVTEITKADAAQLHAAEKITEIIADQSKAEKREILDYLQKKVEATIYTGIQGLLDKAPRRLLTEKRDEPKILHLYATDGVHVLDTVIERDNLTWDAFDALPDEVEDETDRQAQHTLRRIVFGALAYSSAVSNATDRVDATEPKKRPTPSDPRPARWTIGRTITIDRELVRSVRAGAREIAFRLKSRHIVRGHYRNQAHGPERSLRTVKWIMPFWRGPEDGAALVHTYKPKIP